MKRINITWKQIGRIIIEMSIMSLLLYKLPIYLQIILSVLISIALEIAYTRMKTKKFRDSISEATISKIKSNYKLED